MNKYDGYELLGIYTISIGTVAAFTAPETLWSPQGWWGLSIVLAGMILWICGRRKI